MKRKNKIESTINDLDTSGWTVTYHLSTFNISDSNMDNNYLSSTPSKISVKVDIYFLIYILLLVL